MSTAPRIYGCPDTVLSHDNEPGVDYATVTWLEPRILDQSASSMLTSSHNSGDTFFIGQTIVTYVVTDDGPNDETCSFTVEVIGEYGLIHKQRLE